MAFQLCVANQPPEIGYSDRGKPRDTFEEALDEAKALAMGKTVPGRTVQIVSDDGFSVTTVTYVPGEVIGVDEDDNVEREPSTFSIVHDDRRADTKIDKETGEIIVGEEKGKISTREDSV